jgi:tRNA G18 (ribose-2'-O)-methylase SpoU
MRVTPAADLDAPALEPYRTLRRPVDHLHEGIFVAEGPTVVTRLLASGLEVVSALLTPTWLERLRRPLEAYEEGLDVFVAPVATIERIVGFHYHQGVMAVGRVPHARPLAADLAAAPRPRLVVALDGLTSAENVGTIVRNCAAFRVNALLVSGDSASPWLRRAVRNSMGAVFSLSTHQVRSLPATLAHLRAEHGFHVVAATPAGSAPISLANLAGECALVFGHEGHGVSPEVLAACDEAVAIPMPATVDSLNVASATAVFLYETRRRQTPSTRPGG